MRYAFTNSEGIVVQLITGTLSEAQQAQFLQDYATLFGAVAIVEVEPEISVWIGGAYTGGQFLPPVVIEGTSEELPPSEVPDDPLPS